MATGILIEYGTPTHTPPTSFHTPKVETRKSFPQHHLTWPLKGLSAPVADMTSANFDMPFQRHAIPPVPEDSREPWESPSQLLEREMSHVSVDTPTKASPSEWKPTGSEPRLITKESTPKSSPSRVSDRISASSKFSTPDSHNRSHSSTPAERMLIDSPPSHASWIPFQEEMTKFWIDPSRSSTTMTLGTVLKLTRLFSSDKPKAKYPTHLPRILNLKPIDADQESTSTESSYSILSDDTIPLSTPPRLTRFSPQDESEYFIGLYNTIDQAFSQWESKVGYQKADLLEFGNIQDMYLEIPKFTERGVLMGKKPDGDGFWTGNIYLFGPNIILHRLEARQGKNLLGIEIGFIEDFECRRGRIGGAILFFAWDRNVYYTDEDGDVDQDDQGICTFIAHGPYDLRTMGTGCVLDPWPNHPPPPVSWPNIPKSFCGH